MDMKSYISILIFHLVFLSNTSCEIRQVGSFFEKIKGEEIESNETGQHLKLEFRECDRKGSCTYVVQLKNGTYQTIFGEAELNSIEETSCVWKKHVSSEVFFPVCSSIMAMGMESNAISNSSITASSAFSGYEAWKARLNGAVCWMASYFDENPYLQVDFGKEKYVHSVATQGLKDYGVWTRLYEISYSNNGADFYKIMDGSSNASKVFTGNTDDNGVVKNVLPTIIAARYFRIHVHPKGQQSLRVLRIEFYGCDK